MKADRSRTWWVLVVGLIALVGFAIAPAVATVLPSSGGPGGYAVQAAAVPIATPGTVGASGMTSPLVAFSTGVLILSSPSSSSSASSSSAVASGSISAATTTAVSAPISITVSPSGSVSSAASSSAASAPVATSSARAVSSAPASAAAHAASAVSAPAPSGSPSASATQKLTALSVSITPNPAKADAGQTIVFSVTASGGTGLYSYSWYAATGMGCTASISQTFTCTPTYGTSQTVSPAVGVNVTDSNGNTGTTTAVLDFYAAMTTPTMSPASPGTTDEGQTLTISATGNGGTGTYSYSWAVANGDSCPGFTGTPTGSSITYTPSGTTTTCAFTVTVTDTGTVTGSGGSGAPTITGTTAAITVDPTLATPATPTILTPLLDSGQTPNVASDAIPASLGGSGSTVDYTWLASDTGSTGPYTLAIAEQVCNSGTVGPLSATAAVSTTVDCVGSGTATPGTYYFEVEFTDTGTTLPSPHAFTISSDVGTTVVSPALTAPGTPVVKVGSTVITGGKMDADQALTVTSLLSGTGTPTISWTWYISTNGGSSFSAATSAQCGASGTDTGYTGSGAGVSDTITCSVPSNTFSATNSVAFYLSVTDSATTHETAESSDSSGIAVSSALTAPGTPVVKVGSTVITGGKMDADQALTVTSLLSGTGTATISWQWFISVDGGSHFFAAASAQCGASGTDTGYTGSGAGVSDTITCSVPASTFSAGDSVVFFLSVTDSATAPESIDSGDSSAISVSAALAAPTTPTVNSESSNINLDVNEGLTVASTLSTGGTGAISWTWYVNINSGGYGVSTLCGFNSGSSNPGTIIACTIAPSTLTIGDTYVFELQVTDSATAPEGPLDSSPSPTVTVYSLLTAPGTPVVKVGSTVITGGTMDANQALTVTSVLSGTGSPTIGWTWSISTDGGGTFNAATAAECGNSGTDTGYTGSGAAVGATISCVVPANTFSAGNSIEFKLSVTDGSTPAETAQSAASSATGVSSAFTAPSTPTLSVNGGSPLSTAVTLDADQTLTVASTLSGGGTPSVTWNWYYSTNGGANYVLTSTISGTFCGSGTNTGNSGTATSLSATIECAIAANSLTVGDTYIFALVVADAATSPQTLNSPASPDVTVYAALTVSPPTATVTGIDVNQATGSIALTLTRPSTGAPPYGWLVEFSINGSGIVGMTGIAGCNGSPPTTPMGSTETCDITNSALTDALLSGHSGETLYLLLQVTDSATAPETVTSSPLTLSIDSALTAGTPTYSTPSNYVYYGGTVKFTAAASGGSGGDSYVWNMGGFPGCASSVTSTITCTPTSGAGTYSISYTVTDSNGNTVTSSTLSNYIVYSTPTASEPTPNNSVLDVGQSYTFSTTASGGTGSFTTYTWAESSSNLGCSLVNAAAITCTPTSTTGEPFSLMVKVTDSNGVTGPFSGAATITVNGRLSAPTITSAPTVVDSGQTVTISYSAASGGTGSFSYALYVSGNPAGPYSLVVGSRCSAGACTFTASTLVSTTLYYEVQATDTGTTAPSATIFSSDTAITLNPALSAVTVSPASPITTDLGQSITISATWSGGSAPYTAKLYSSATSTCNSGSTLVQTISSLGTGSVAFGAQAPSGSAPFHIYYCVVVTDSSLGSPAAFSTSTALNVLVNPDPTVSVTAATVNYDQGQSPVAITATVTYTTGSGNTITVSWYQSTSSSTCTIIGSVQASGTGPVYQFTPPTTNVGTTSYCAVVTDSGVPSYSANSGSGVVTVIVHAPPTVSVNGGTAYTVTYDRTQVAKVTALVTYFGSNTATVNWYVSASASTCSPTGVSIGSESAAPYTLTIPTSSTGTTSYCAVVTDSGVPAYTSNSGTGVITVVVNPLPTVAISTPGPFGYDVGQSASALTAVVTYTLGSGNTITVTWYSSTASGAAACAPGTSTGVTGLSFTPSTSSAGTTYYCALVTDSGVPSYSSASSPVTVVVNPDPTVSIPTTVGPYTYVIGATPTDLVASVTYTFALYSPATSNVITVTWYSSTVSAADACNPSVGTPTGTSTTITAGHTTSSQTPSTATGETTTWYCAVVTDSGVPSFHSSSSAVEVIVNPSLTLSPTSGIVGSTTTATGDGYTADATVTFTLDSVSAISSCTASGTGTIDCSVTIPAVPGGVPGGIETMVASDGSGYTGSAAFTVDGSFSISPNQAPSGGTFTLTATGLLASTDYGTGLFSGNTQIAVLAVSSCSVGTNNGATFETNADGSATCLLEVPSSDTVTPGTYGVSTAALPQQTLTITTPTIALNYIQGPSGSLVLLTGSGFTTSDGTVTISLEISGSAALSPTSCGATNSDGAFSCDVTITGTPSGTPYTITAAGSDSTFGGFDSATAQFTITSANGYLFTETGLSGQFWSVSIGSTTRGTSGPSVLFPSYLSGFYTVHAPYGFTASPSSGFVSGGSASILITFTPTGTTFTATFTESGLVTGTSWTVMVGGLPHSSTGATISVSGLTGSVSYTVEPVAGYTLSGAVSGDVTSASHTVDVTYAQTGAPFQATFTESGLDTGVTWSVTVGPTTYQATVGADSGTTITVSGLTGSVAYAFNAVTGYTITAGASGFVSSGSPDASATYTPNGATLTVTFTESGLPARTIWNVVVTDPVLGTVSRATAATSLTISGLKLGDSFSAFATGFSACPGAVSGSSVSVQFYLGFHICEESLGFHMTHSSTSAAPAAGAWAAFGLLFESLAALVAAVGVGLVVLWTRTPRTKGPAPPVV